jgi:16S rRNA (adenine1518-N6/adenine1519-N6)-dimethyltransferase
VAGVGPGDRVVEIGAGVGSLTLALADTGARVTAIEIDRLLVPALREVVHGRDVRVVEADALALDWERVLGGGSWALVANLPYNVATPLVLDLLDSVPAIDRMLVMVQREAGERLAARRGDAAYGAVSAKVAFWAEASLAGRVPASVFLPPPKVESVLVRIARHAALRVGDEDARRDLFALLERGFATRRKMLRRALAGVIDASAYACAGVRPEARAEELSIDDWVTLWRCSSGRSPS